MSFFNFHFKKKEIKLSLEKTKRTRHFDIFLQTISRTTWSQMYINPKTVTLRRQLTKTQSADISRDTNSMSAKNSRARVTDFLRKVNPLINKSVMWATLC